MSKNAEVPFFDPSDELKSQIIDNMILWNQVWITPPQITKGFKKRGFKGSAINPQQQRKLLTGIFGPKGIGWGVRDAKIKVLNADTFHAFAQYSGTFWYKFPANQKLWGDFATQAGEYGMQASMSLWQQASYIDKDTGTKPWFFKEDYAKILATDALTKGMSELGFGSDIFEGLFDDVKYLIDANAYFAQAYPNLKDSRDAAEKAIAEGGRRTYGGSNAAPAAKAPPKANPKPEAEAPKVFAYSGPNKDNARSLFLKGQTAEEVIDRIVSLGFIMPEDQAKLLREDYEKLNKMADGE